MGLIGDYIQTDPFRNTREDARYSILHTLDCLDGVGPWLAIDRYVNLAPAVDMDDVGLNCKGILNGADISDKDRRSILDLHRKVVDLLDSRHHSVGVDLIIQIADLGVSQRNEHVEASQRLHHIHRREAVPSEPVGIEVHEDPP